MSSPVQESDRNTLVAPEPDPEPESGTQNENEREASAATTETDITDSDSEKTKVQETEQSPSFALKMLNFCKEVTIMMLIAIVYAALTSENPPKVSKSPAAYPFFTRKSPITDWYKGHVFEAIEEARSSNIAFVMFYAPWDAESQTVRKEVEFAADYLSETVTFTAINCWQPGSECRRQYSKVYKWPVLIAYPTHGRGIQYGGPLEAYHIIRFLQNVCKPIIRVDNTDELIGKHDVVVSAKIDVLPGSRTFAIYYSTALRFLERDPLRETVFAIIPQKRENIPILEIHNWNGTIRYDGEWSVNDLTSWILKNTHQIIRWVSPTGMKSMNFANFVQPGPTLILFTPKNPLSDQIDHYEMLREVAYEYNNCQNQAPLSKKIESIKLHRSQNYNNYLQSKRKCTLLKPVVSLTNVWSNITVTDICNCASGCQDFLPDPKCRDFLLAEQYAPSVFEGRGFDGKEGGVDVSGLACANNSTLRFVVIDSLRFYAIAERLGVELRSSGFSRSGAVIVNDKMETHHVMPTSVTSSNLRSFVLDFTRKNLSRSLLTKVNINTKRNYFYPHFECSKINEICAKELTSQNFLETILDDKLVLVFYYSKQCSFCNGAAYTFLTVAKMLATLGEEVTFARIDGDLNLLPWEYTMDTYPTVLLLPPQRKPESRTFPRNLPITVPNLLGFILTNMEPVLKLKTMWSICCQSKFSDAKAKCLTSLRIETLSVIGNTLKEWRITPRKGKVLHKLQVLRQLHLSFAHSPEDVGIGRFFKRLNGLF